MIVAAVFFFCCDYWRFWHFTLKDLRFLVLDGDESMGVGIVKRTKFNRKFDVVSILIFSRIEFV